MFLKLLITILLIYWGAKLIKILFSSMPKDNEIKGNPHKNDELDLSKHDVEDADFEEIDE